MVSIVTWNINSIRNKVESINDFLNKESPDILFITETKITQKFEKSISEKIDNNYGSIWNSNKSSHWHGTCFIYKIKTFHKVNVISNSIESVSIEYKTENNTLNSKKINTTNETDIDIDTKKGHQDEGRILLCEFTLKNMEKLIILGTYSPNSGVDRNNPLKRLAYRTLRWDFDVYNTLNNLKTKYKNILWIGDLNVARKQNDIAYKMNIAGTTIEERSNFENFFKDDEWIDTFDFTNPEKTKIIDRCTYGYSKKCKLRLDYIICCNELKKNIKNSNVLHEYDSVSDHLPIVTNFSF